MKKSIIKTLSLLLAMLMVIGLFAGCNQNPGEDTKPSESTPATEGGEKDPTQGSVNLEDVDFAGTEFRVAWWGADARHNNTLEMLKDFSSKYKNLTVKEQYTGWSDYFQQIETQLTGNIEPDVYQMDWSKILTFAESDQLLDLTPYIESGALDMSNVDPSTIAIGEMAGGNYAIATGINAPIYVYNPALAKEAGVTIDESMTWDEFIDACKKVYDKTGAMANIEFEEFMRTRGESYYTKDGKAVAFSAGTLSDWWKIKTEGMEYGYFATPENMPDDTATGLTDGDYWIYTTYTNQLHTMEKNTALDLDWTAIPTSEYNTATSFIKPNTLWVIKADTKYPDLAVAFLNYWVNNTKVYDICGIDRGFPISSEIIKYLEPNFDDNNKEVVEMLDYLTENELLSPIAPPAPAKDSGAKSALSPYMEEVDYGMIDKADFVAKAEEAIAKMNKALQAD